MRKITTKNHDRRRSDERRIHNDANYAGPERRSGIDSRGWQEITIIKANNTPKTNNMNTQWLHGYSKVQSHMTLH